MRPEDDRAPRYHHGDLREALIKKAIETIHEAGVEAVSLRALARKIGVSHAAPMRHFPTRAALLGAIARNGITSLLKSASNQAAKPELTSKEKLIALAEGYVRWAAANPAHHMLIRNQDVMRHADGDLLQDIATYAQLHEQAITQAQKDGWRTSEPTRGLFLQITALTAGLALVASDPIYQTVFGDRPVEEEIKTALAAFFE